MTIDETYRRQEQVRARNEFADRMSDLKIAQENAYNADVNDINAWINEISESVTLCNIDISEIAELTHRITTLTESVSSNKRTLGDVTTNKLYERIEQAETNLSSTISEINKNCVLRK